MKQPILPMITDAKEFSFEGSPLIVVTHNGTDYLATSHLQRCAKLSSNTLYPRIVKDHDSWKPLMAHVRVECKNGQLAGTHMDKKMVLLPVTLVPAILATLRVDRMSVEQRIIVNSLIKDIDAAVELELGRKVLGVSPLASAEHYHPPVAVAEPAPVIAHKKTESVTVVEKPRSSIMGMLMQVVLSVPGPQRQQVSLDVVHQIKREVGTNDIFSLTEDQEAMAMIALANKL